MLMRSNRWRIAAGMAGLLVAGTGWAHADSRLADAVKAGDKATVIALLGKRADVNAAEVDGTTPLHWAVRADDVDLTRRLLRAGARVKTANRYGVTPLALAAENGNPAMLEALLLA